MNDLFGGLEEVREKSGEVRKGSGVLRPALTWKGKSGSTGLSLAGSPAKSDGLPLPRFRAERRSTSELLAEADRLRFEIENAEAIMLREDAIQRPFRAAFNAATLNLEYLHKSRRNGEPISKEIMVAAYDARVDAGHAWDGPRREYNMALAWAKSMREDLKKINKELDK